MVQVIGSLVKQGIIFVDCPVDFDVPFESHSFQQGYPQPNDESSTAMKITQTPSLAVQTGQDLLSRAFSGARAAGARPKRLAWQQLFPSVSGTIHLCVNDGTSKHLRKITFYSCSRLCALKVVSSCGVEFSLPSQRPRDSRYSLDSSQACGTMAKALLWKGNMSTQCPTGPCARPLTRSYGKHDI